MGHIVSTRTCQQLKTTELTKNKEGEWTFEAAHDVGANAGADANELEVVDGVLPLTRTRRDIEQVVHVDQHREALQHWPSLCGPHEVTNSSNAHQSQYGGQVKDG